VYFRVESAADCGEIAFIHHADRAVIGTSARENCERSGVVGGDVDIAAVHDADRIEVGKIRNSGDADGIRGGEAVIRACLHAYRAAPNGEDTVGSANRGRAGNIPAVLDAGRAVDACVGEDAERTAPTTYRDSAAIVDADETVRSGLHTNARNILVIADGSDIAAVDDADRAAALGIYVDASGAARERAVGPCEDVAVALDGDGTTRTAILGKNARRELVPGCRDIARVLDV
jgi:hypothetical protein